MKFSRFKFINVRKYETVKTTTKKTKKNTDVSIENRDWKAKVKVISKHTNF